jgi:hypothetical protein
MTNHLFSFESLFLLPDRLCVLKRSKSLRNSVLLLLLLCVLRLFPVPLVLSSCAGVDPTTHIILLCASALLPVTVWS